ncbi:porin [Polynucleobacter sp.]|uniref:porin n=1 Tax=Polynucleobacter sp. TaxID=2029855 RepID=UPI00261E1C14|nr:porin [Polynucleobacter sp.]MCW1965919.1 porin [Polynucleobacter sp.]
MKKSLLAVAAMTAFAGAAQAQSSVTIYGILDVGYINQKSDGAGASATTKSNNSFIGQSAEQTSRLGFKGTEDLGGGSSAFFTVETQLNPNSATVSTWNNRQSFAGLKKNGIGQVTLGTQYTPIFTTAVATDPGQFNNMPGNVVYASSIAGGAANPGTASYASTSQPGNTTDAFTVRTSNTIKLQSDKFAGASLGVMYTQNGTTTTPATTGETKNNYTGWGVNIDYAWNKLYIAAAMQRLKSDNLSPTTTLTSPTPSAWINAGGGVNTQDNQAYVGATYDFGILKAYLQYVSRKDTSTLNTNYFAKRSAQQIGVRSYITPTIEGWASWGNGKVTSWGASSPNANFVAWQAGLNYYLSKRTNLYGIYGANNLSSAYPVNPAVNTSAFALGVRHTF